MMPFAPVNPCGSHSPPLAALIARASETDVLLTNHRGSVIRLWLGKRVGLFSARGERPMPLWWRMTPDTNLAHGLRRP